MLLDLMNPFAQARALRELHARVCTTPDLCLSDIQVLQRSQHEKAAAAAPVPRPAAPQCWAPHQPLQPMGMPMPMSMPMPMPMPMRGHPSGVPTLYPIQPPQQVREVMR